jgi:hypothetical protein
VQARRAEIEHAEDSRSPAPEQAVDDLLDGSPFGPEFGDLAAALLDVATALARQYADSGDDGSMLGLASFGERDQAKREAMLAEADERRARYVDPATRMLTTWITDLDRYHDDGEVNEEAVRLSEAQEYARIALADERPIEDLPPGTLMRKLRDELGRCRAERVQEEGAAVRRLTEVALKYLAS